MGPSRAAFLPALGPYYRWFECLSRKARSTQRLWVACLLRKKARSRGRLLAQACIRSANRWSSVNGIARRVLFFLPFRLDQFHHVGRHGNVIEFERHAIAAFIRPIEELERDGGVLRLFLFFVHQDKCRAGNRPALFARLIGQNLVEPGGLVPLRIRSGGPESLVIGPDEV